MVMNLVYSWRSFRESGPFGIVLSYVYTDLLRNRMYDSYCTVGMGALQFLTFFQHSKTISKIFLPICLSRTVAFNT